MIQNPLDVYRTFVESHPDYKGVINIEYLPYERYKVDAVWRPESVDVLFLGEAPSWHSKGGTPSWHSPGPYFYDPEYSYKQGRIGTTARALPSNIFPNIEVGSLA